MTCAIEENSQVTSQGRNPKRSWDGPTNHTMVEELPKDFEKKHIHRCMRRCLQERGWCQRIYLGTGRRKKKDKQRRADLEMEREESEEATLPKRSSRSARGAGREQRRVTLQRRRRQSAADKTKLLEAGGSTLVGQRPKENDHKHSKRSKEKG